ncbi:hypothetical protein PQX77_012416 [Marasmius sp. AFHP31]|nr:hypothetical protein PQX77_012416 [Marasmius sp. AFHP31]
MRASALAFCGKRLFSTSPLELKSQFRALLRESAQPVAVVTTKTHSASSPSPSHSGSHSQYHGATLSSFTSIAMDPHPLIAFSLRLPSRMATYLSEVKAEKRHSDSSESTETEAQLVINILSAAQEPLAVVFSRPDLHPRPFSSSVEYELNRDGIPVLNGSLGAISCRLVTPPIPLHNLGSLRKGLEPGSILREQQMENEADVVDGVTSELFIARVVDVQLSGEEEGHEERMPLLYHRRGYTTCRLDYNGKK